MSFPTPADKAPPAPTWRPAPRPDNRPIQPMDDSFYPCRNVRIESYECPSRALRRLTVLIALAVLLIAAGLFAWRMGR